MYYFFQQISTSPIQPLRVAIIGQSAFAVDVFNRLRQHGHIIVGVFTIPDKGKREDPLGILINITEFFIPTENIDLYATGFVNNQGHKECIKYFCVGISLKRWRNCTLSNFT